VGKIRDRALIEAAAVGALVLAAAALWVFGVGEHGLHVALRVTARWSFLWFWGAYAGGALRAVFGEVFEALARRGRGLGLSYAAAQTVHAGIVAWLYCVAVKPPLGARGTAFFLVGLGITYLLVGLSFGGTRRLPWWVWKIVRVAGMEYIALAFFVDFVRHPVTGVWDAAFYWPFIVLAISGAGLRIVSATGVRFPTAAS
jgi:hypothetical protein